MKSVYVDLATGATALLSKYKGRIYTIDSIACPVENRSKRGASRALAMVTADADDTGISLRLLVAPTGGLKYAALVSWYVRNGFEEVIALHYLRLPKRLQQYGQTMHTPKSDGADREGQMQLGRVHGLHEARSEEA